MQENSVYSASSRPSVLETNKVLRNTYMLLAMTLVFSAVCAGITMMTGMSRMGALVMSIGALAMIWFVIPKVAHKPSGIVWTFAFTGLLGGSIGPMLSAYLSIPGGSEIVMQAMGGTALIFFTLSAYVLTTKKDFSFMAGFLMTGLIVAIVAALANFFLQIPALSLAVSSAIVFIMSGFILYDTSRIINGGEKNYVMATIGLYLSIYNIFVNLLSILGIMGGDD